VRITLNSIQAKTLTLVFLSESYVSRPGQPRICSHSIYTQMLTGFCQQVVWKSPFLLFSCIYLIYTCNIHVILAFNVMFLNEYHIVSTMYTINSSCTPCTEMKAYKLEFHICHLVSKDQSVLTSSYNYACDGIDEILTL